MTIINNVNFWLTIVSIVVTIISIFFSCLSYRHSQNAKRYKEETLKFKEVLDLRSLLEELKLEGQNYQNKTRKLDWYRGQDANSIITAFNKVLLSFGNYYHLLENETDIKDKVHRLQVSIQNYSRFTRDVQRSINDLIIDITELLQGEIQRNTSKIITDQ